MKLSPLFGALVAVSHSLANLAAPALAGAQEAERVTVRPAVTAGKELTYDLSLDAMASQDGVDNHVVQSVRVRLEVTSVEDSGAAEVVARLDRLTGMWRDGAGQVEFSWSRAEDPEVERATSTDKEFEAINKALAGAAVRLRIDVEGRITAVSGLEEAAGAAAGSDRFGLAGLALFAPAQVVNSLSPIWRADGLTGTRSAGSGWQSTREVPVGPAGQIDFVTEWVVTGVSDGVAAYTGSESATLMRPTAPDSAAPSVVISSHEGRVEGAWSVAAGALQRRVQTRAMATEWRLGDVTIRQDQRIKQTAALAP